MNQLLSALVVLAAVPYFAAQAIDLAAWPTRPVTVVVPFGAGGGVDTAARIVLPKLAERLGQQVVIDHM